MEVEALPLAGCLVLRPTVRADQRGAFVKFFERAPWERLGLVTEFAEEYYSVSHRGVVRGMHFQVPPHDHAKVVWCIAGAVFDACVDLRRASPTYGQSHSLELNADDPAVLYLPRGIAHGFCALEDHSVLVYKVETAYAPEHDEGVHWQSCGVSWPDCADPDLVSERDQQHPDLRAFVSPF